nr:leucyl-tRNA synthetase, putative [Ipomoea batatas]GME13364.1 leucyl-tRNA synthetase, putative [Ipomoea batatas]
MSPHEYASSLFSKYTWEGGINCLHRSLCILTSSFVLSIPLVSVFCQNWDIRSPQSEIVPEKLHYQGTVFVGVLVQGIQFRNCLIKSLLCKVTSPEMRVHDLVVENREIQSQSQANRMCRW